MAVLELVRREGVTSPSVISSRLHISLATVMRVVQDLTEQGLVAHDGFDEAARGRPPARIRFQGVAHAIIGIEASKSGFYGAVTDLEGTVQTERSVAASADGPANVAVLTRLIEELIASPRPAGQTILGIGVGVPSIVRQPAGEVVLTLGLGWRDLPLREIIATQFGLPVLVENGRNLAAVGEWEFGAGRGAGSVVSLAIGPGAGAGIVIDGKLHGGRSNAAGEISWYLDDPLLSGRSFPHLGDKTSLRHNGIGNDVFDVLEDMDRFYTSGRFTLDELSSTGVGAEAGLFADVIDYATLAVASLSAVLNPEVIVLAGRLTRGGTLVLDLLARRLEGSIYDPPRLVIGTLGHRHIALGAIRLVLDATALDPDHRP